MRFIRGKAGGGVGQRRLGEPSNSEGGVIPPVRERKDEGLGRKHLRGQHNSNKGEARLTGSFQTKIGSGRYPHIRRISSLGTPIMIRC